MDLTSVLPPDPEREGWHWLQTPTHGPVLCLWRQYEGRQGDWRWHYQGDQDISPAALEVCEYRYVGRAVPPAEVAQLRTALRDALREMEYLTRQLAARGLPGMPGDTVDRVMDAARAALAPAS